jgi:hypothetical protein
VSDFKRAFFARVKEKGGWQVILERIANGETFKQIAPDYGVSKSYVHRMISRKSQPKLREAYERARRESAEAHAQKALEILDNVTPTRDEIAKARAQAEHRRWLAQAYDRDTFGPPQQNAQVTLNIASLHLDALRRAAPPRALPSGASPAELPVLPATIESAQ